jgi:signal transduction histidine kinase
VDPRRVKRNPMPPPVQVRALVANGREYAAAGHVALPPRTTALAISYAALGLGVPERVRFRYRLLGLDTAWQDGGTRREASYTNLGPGEYRFQVVAANEDGVWNNAGAALDLTIPATFAQTPAFLMLCAASAAAVVWLLQHWRQRRATAAIRARFEATLAERARIARELHDTLLSEVTGVAMRLDAAAVASRGSAAPPGADASTLAAIRDQVYAALAGARRSVIAMRALTSEAPEYDRPLLPGRLKEAARRIYAGSHIELRVDHQGVPRPYPPAAEDEVLRIASEAMTNARRHARCRTVVATCTYGPDGLSVRVRDDGSGFDPALANANGHFGLIGMRERAAAIGARLTVESSPGSGTEVLLVLRRPSG